MWLSVYDAQLHLPDAEESFASPYKILLGILEDHFSHFSPESKPIC